MELKIKRGEFLNLLRWSQGITDRRSPMPILSNLLLEVKDKNLKVTATDLEIVLSTEGPIEGQGQERWAVNARHLYELVKEAPTEDLRLVPVEGRGLKVVSGKAEFRMVGLNPDDFPQIPSVARKGEISIDPEDLSEMIEKTLYAVSTDETRYMLNGVYLILADDGGEDKKKLRLVATDGHRLSYAERGLEKKWKLGKGLLIPRKGIQELRRLLTEGEGELFVVTDEKVISFRRGPVSLTIRLIEGEFPAYEQVIPKNTDKLIPLARETLFGALKRASIFTSVDGRGVKLAISSNLVEIRSTHPDLGETLEELQVDYRGPRFEVAFNPRYLIDVLSILEDEKVILELKDEVSPCVIRSEFDKGFLALVMPMRL